MTNKQRGQEAKKASREMTEEEKRAAISTITAQAPLVPLAETEESKALKIKANLAQDLKTHPSQALKKKDVDKEVAKKTISNKSILPPDIMALKQKDKVAIVGFAPSWYQAPFKDKEFEIWGINNLYKLDNEGRNRFKIYPRYDKWFEIHDIRNSPSKQDPEHQAWLKNCKMPLFTQDHYEEYPSSVKYPRDEIKALVNDSFAISDVGAPFTDYSNQITWMIVLASFMGYKEIHIYGVDMAANTEYNFQRASCQYFIGLAAGMGIKILIPHESELCKHARDYGWDSDNANRHMKKRRIDDIGSRLMDMEAKIKSNKFDIKQLTEETESHTVLMNEDLKQLKTDKSRFLALIDANKVLIEFLKNSPGTLKEYLNKRTEVLKQTESFLQQDAETIKKIEQEILNRVKKRDDKKRKTFINIEMLKDEETHIKNTLYTNQGAIGECKHDLSNNLV